MTVFDEIADTDGDDEWKAWLEKVFASRDEIVTFDAGHREGGTAGEFVHYPRVLSTSVSSLDSTMEAGLHYSVPKAGTYGSCSYGRKNHE
jgi:hypothetical protein